MDRPEGLARVPGGHGVGSCGGLLRHGGASTASVSPAGDGLRVLFRNRPNALTQPGGDTVLMLRLVAELAKMGVAVEVDCEGRLSPEDFDLVHLFNLCTPGITEPMARDADARGRRFVVHACQEDFPRYLSRAIAAVPVFTSYVKKGQPRGSLELALPSLAGVPPVEPITSTFILENAAAVFACGPTEAAYIKSLHESVRLRVTPYGADAGYDEGDGSLFEKTFGLKRFVLCVGRLEPRKNQLMLLAALEDVDVPLVFADAGFSYQPEYEALCRRYKRKAPTVFTGRLSEEMLASAYRAAGAHCLPSWYELPGLVSLEAAACGCSVAASSWGALPDYLGGFCWYCEPDDPAGIRAAVLGALEEPAESAAPSAVRRFTWEDTAEAVLGTYLEIIGESHFPAVRAASGSLHG